MGIAQTLDIRTSDKETPRSFFWIWYIRIFQLILTLVVLGIAAANIASFGNLDCSVPGKLAWNVACAVLTFIVLMYFMFSTGPKPVLKVLPWFLIGQLFLDFVMLIFWISAAAVSRLNCDDQCAACSGSDWVRFDGLYCTCTVFDYTLWKRDAAPSSSANPSAFAGGLEKRARRKNGSSGLRGAKTGLSAILVVLFFATLCAGIMSLFQHIQAQRRNTNPGATNGGTNGGGVTSITHEPKHEEAGVPQQQQQPPMQQTNGPQQQQPPPPMNPNYSQPQSPVNQVNGFNQPQQQGSPYPPQQQQQLAHSYQAPLNSAYGHSEINEGAVQNQGPVNMYGGGAGPQASYPGPEPQGPHFGYSEMGSEPSREQTVSPELQGSDGHGAPRA